MKKIAVLGSTGSIGTQSLDVIAASEGKWCCSCICAGGNAELLAKQANKFRPQLVGICQEHMYKDLVRQLEYKPQIAVGAQAAQICAENAVSDIVINGISGISGFLPLVSAIKAGKTIAAANKESIVCAHSILDDIKTDVSAPLVAPFANGARIIPVDSEQSAIFQCLETTENIESLILTASGGAFRSLTIEELETVTISDALKHPTWSMGKKITVDSASLFNKGLEIMEAAYLFGFDAEHIEVLVHPQSIVHSMVRFTDGSIKAQLSVPDMRGAIQYAITYPHRQKCPIARLEMDSLALTFEKPDNAKYPALDLAYSALREGHVLPIAYNAANEVAVDLFMHGKCRFTDIAKIVAYAMKRMDTAWHYSSVDDIIAIDNEARIQAQNYLN